MERLAPVADVAAAAAALKASEARYRRLFETAKDGIFILDAATGHIIDVNPFLVQLLGYGREDLVGRQLWELGPFQDIAASRDAFRDLQAKEYIRYEHLPLESRDGRHTDVEFVSNAYQVNGERVIQCNVRDITERKRAAATASARYAEVERQLQERTAAAAGLAAKLETISYAVSRHLPATLRQIEDFSELLKEEHGAQLDSLGRQYVDGIQADARRVRTLIAELLRSSPA